MPTGSCLCKNLKYEFTGEPQVLLCHCLPCRRLSGSTFSTNLLVPESDFTLHGTPKTIQRPGDSGKNVTLHFCPDCGHTLFVKVEAYPGLAVVKAGTLDDVGLIDGLKPAKEIYCKDKVAWLPKLAEEQVEGAG